MLLINTFSPNMVDGSFTAFFEQISETRAYGCLRDEGFTSAISSKEVAFLFGSVLQLPLSTNNITISMGSGDVAILGLYKGPKIKNKQANLTEGAVIKWFLLTID